MENKAIVKLTQVFRFRIFSFSRVKQICGTISLQQSQVSLVRLLGFTYISAYLHQLYRKLRIYGRFFKYFNYHFCSFIFWF